MRPLAGLLGVLLCAASLHAAPLHKVSGATPDGYIVTLSADTPAARYADSLTRSAGARLVHVYDIVLNGFSVRATEQQALALTKLPGVLSVTQTRYLTPTEVRSPSVDGPDRIDQRALDLDDSYTFTMYTAPTTIYLLDTGVDPRAEFGNRITNINFFTNTSGVRDPTDYTDNGLPLDDLYHGTPSAVIAAGGVNGIAPFAKIANVRVCDFSTCRSDDIVAGVKRIAAMPADADGHPLKRVTIRKAVRLPRS